MKGMFCPSCGETKGPFFQSLCKKCFLAKHKLVVLPDEIKIDHCGSCNSIRLEGKWVNQSEQALKNFVKKKVKVKELHKPLLSFSLEPTGETTLAVARATGSIGKEKISAEAKTLLIPAETQCDSCMKAKSQYFEATLQFRLGSASREQKEEIFSEVENALAGMQENDKLALIVDVVDSKSGLDIVLASNRAAKKLVKIFEPRLSSHVKKSFKLAGFDSRGKEKKRFTYCLRL